MQLTFFFRTRCEDESISRSRGLAGDNLRTRKKDNMNVLSGYVCFLCTVFIHVTSPLSTLHVDTSLVFAQLPIHCMRMFKETSLANGRNVVEIQCNNNYVSLPLICIHAIIMSVTHNVHQHQVMTIIHQCTSTCTCT